MARKRISQTMLLARSSPSSTSVPPSPLAVRIISLALLALAQAIHGHARLVSERESFNVASNESSSKPASRIASLRSFPSSYSHPSSYSAAAAAAAVRKSPVRVAWSSRVRLNHLQMVGVHNSYHVAPKRDLLTFLMVISNEFRGWEYTHKPLTALLRAGVRSFELDVFYDPKGAHYYYRQGNWLTGKNVASGKPELLRPGFKVLHVQDLDYGTTCLTLVICLRQLYSWSRAHPNHLPITIKIEPKDKTIEQMAGSTAGFFLQKAAKPYPVTAEVLSALENEVLSVIPRNRIIKPDDVRGAYNTLMGAIRRRGWPTLKQAAGRFIFMMVNDRAIDIYRTGAPSLQRRLFFSGSAAIGREDAAFVSGVSAADVQAQLRLGGMVWGRTDSDTREARSNDVSNKRLVISSGAQIVHTDYPHTERPNPFGTPYYVGLPYNLKARCNPLTAPTWCRNKMLTEPVR